ncbi:signal transduction histidine kinase [Brevundimonas alba]|uniref:histidine kinase n=1 Tax=Brevundimonas alba TaxID=74314 RepID=A0A7X6BPK5_9CAUL|nr:ATP-binding protein [Brevundimonas alba]NJC41601.1 signal transduction histidine kinase [Brevundimonas alba]
MAAAIAAKDWSLTPLGPIESWPPALKTTVSLILASGFPQAIVWGEGLTTIYNDAFAPILGDKADPLGKAFNEIWSEAWPSLQPIAEAAFEGQSTYVEDFPLEIERGEGPEHAFFTFSYSPIRDENGLVVGMLDTVTETTAAVVAREKLGFLDALGRALAGIEDPDVILAVTTRLVAARLGLSNCAYADMDEDEDGFTIRGDWAAPGSPSIVGHYSLADFGLLAVQELSAARPLIVNDNLKELAPEEAATFQNIGIAATICMPLVKNGRLTALMAIHDRKPHRWSAFELDLIGEVTERSWAHIERVRAAADLRASMRELDELNRTLEKKVEQAVAERVTAEEALRHTQRLEAIGQLTGGVAHDFNNLLTIIRGSADLLARDNVPEARRERYITAIRETADRAAKLTSQLLSFSRRQALTPRVFDVGARARVIGEMMRSTLGEQLSVDVASVATGLFTNADPVEFETSLLNLGVNARDAMAGAGVLSLAVEPVSSIPSIRGQPARSGDYIALRVSDTGPGIAVADHARIFEPFYTTKPVGEGTGLGLSQVFGFANQSGGDIAIESEEGRGAAFTLYLPRTPAPPVTDEAGEEAGPAGKAQGRILVVEDNADVGAFAINLLEDLGYQPVLTSSGEAALDLLGTDDAFDLVFSDVLMPGMDGVALGAAIRQRWPGKAVLLTSGYSHALATDAEHGFDVLRKPYAIEELSLAIRRLLG